MEKRPGLHCSLSSLPDGATTDRGRPPPALTGSDDFSVSAFHLLFHLHSGNFFLVRLAWLTSRSHLVLEKSKGYAIRSKLEEAQVDGMWIFSSKQRLNNLSLFLSKCFPKK